MGCVSRARYPAAMAERLQHRPFFVGVCFRTPAGRPGADVAVPDERGGYGNSAFPCDSKPKERRFVSGEVVLQGE